MNLKIILKSIRQNYDYYPRIYNYAFLALFMGVIYLYKFQHTIFYPPQSVHQYRQSDCLSIAENYYYHDMNFFKPQLHNQMSEGGSSGYVSGEFPALYYLVAFLWKIFGHHDFIYRLVNILIVFSGLFALFKILEDLFKNSFWALILTFFLFSSPVIVFYTNNYLTNMPAFSLVLIGWYFFYKYYVNGKSMSLIWSVCFFTLAGLIKVSSAISLILIITIFIIEILWKINFRSHKKLFERRGLCISIFVASLFIIFSWYFYSYQFNKNYGGSYTFNNIWSIFKMDAAEISTVVKGFNEFMVHQLFSKSLLWGSIIMLPIIILFWIKKKLDGKIVLVFSILLLGVIMYILLWFHAFGNHDYYMIDPIIIFVALWVVFFTGLKNYSPRLFKNIFFKSAFVIVLIYNLLYCQNNMHMRYWMYINHPERYSSEIEIGGWAWIHLNYVNHFEAYTTVGHYLEALGADKSDKIISIPDESINVSLVLMNYKGWTSYGFSEETLGKRIEKLITKGANFLLINDSSVYKDTSIAPFLANHLGTYKNIDVYKLK